MSGCQVLTHTPRLDPRHQRYSIQIGSEDESYCALPRSVSQCKPISYLSVLTTSHAKI